MSYHLDSKLGAIFIGNLVAGIFYGVTTVQSLTYFRKTHGDSILFRLVVFGLWLLDSVNVAFVTHALYFYLVTRYGDFAVTLEIRWSIIAPIFVNSVMLTLIRLHFARRIYRMLDRNIFLFVCTFLASLLSFSTGIAGGVRVFQWNIKTFAGLNKINYLIYLTLSSGVAADILVVGPLLFLAGRSRLGLRPANTLDTLVQVIINTALVAGLASIATLVTYAVRPQEYIFLAIYFTLSKLYFNAMLSTLNGRSTITAEFQEITNIPSSPVRHIRRKPSPGGTGTDESETAAYNTSSSGPDSRFSSLSSSDEPPRLEIRRIASEDAMEIRRVLASQKEPATQMPLRVQPQLA